LIYAWGMYGGCSKDKYITHFYWQFTHFGGQSTHIYFFTNHLTNMTQKPGLAKAAAGHHRQQQLSHLASVLFIYLDKETFETNRLKKDYK